MITSALQIQQPQYNFKILLIGDSGVGKTSILSSFVNGTFEEGLKSTVGVDLRVKMVQVNDQDVRCILWDTAGQERFRTLTSAYYRGAQGVVLTYDMTSRSSFIDLKSWIKEMDQYLTTDPVTIIVANKVDRKDERTVSTSEGMAFAREQGTMYIETSAKTQQGIQQAFEELLQKIIELPQLCYDITEKTTINVQPESTTDGYCSYC
jgi:Ras-related protein Rab-18